MLGSEFLLSVLFAIFVGSMGIAAILALSIFTVFTWLIIDVILEEIR